MKPRTIILYAGSLRPSGGLTVAKIILEALEKLEYDRVVVYTGSQDGSEGLQSIIESSSIFEERKFFPFMPGFFRYVVSKIYFIFFHLRREFDKETVIVSVDYIIPCFLKLVVFHLNLGLYVDMGSRSIARMVKRKDSRLACRYAAINIFESNFLKSKAQEENGICRQNDEVLYVGADIEFYQERTGKWNRKDGNILVVSSAQPHKDNPCCIRALAELCKRRPGVKWQMTFAGGQSAKQWGHLEGLAAELGVADSVTFTGPLKKPELADILSTSLCLISASRVESFCMVAIEAMAVGCPVVVTRETTMPESVGDAARIVNAGDSVAFSEEIQVFYDFYEQREIVVRKGYEWSKQFHPSSFVINLKSILTGYGLIPQSAQEERQAFDNREN